MAKLAEKYPDKKDFIDKVGIVSSVAFKYILFAGLILVPYVVFINILIQIAASVIIQEIQGGGQQAPPPQL